jgi:hypothetical protein
MPNGLPRLAPPHLLLCFYVMVYIGHAILCGATQLLIAPRKLVPKELVFENLV